MSEILVHKTKDFDNNILKISKDSILEKVQYDKDDIVFIAGSLVENSVSKYCEGMGNRLSDIDVFVLTREYSRRSTRYNNGKMKIDFDLHGYIYFDTETYDLGLFERIINGVGQCKFDNIVNATSLVKLDESFNIFDYDTLLHRFGYGVPISNEIKFGELRARYNLDNYLRIKRRMEINLIDSSLDDVVGNWEVGNYSVAVFLGREILLRTVKAYLFSKGVSLDRDKWILLKFENFGVVDKSTMDLYNEFEKLYYCDLVSDIDKKKVVKSIVKFCNNIVQSITEKDGF